jgi:hypothetical protein
MTRLNKKNHPATTPHPDHSKLKRRAGLAIAGAIAPLAVFVPGTAAEAPVPVEPCQDWVSSVVETPESKFCEQLASEASVARSTSAPNSDWHRILREDFDGHRLKDTWHNVGTGTEASCLDVKGSKLILPPNERLECSFAHSEQFGAGEDKGTTYRFEAKMKVPQSKGHFASFWLKSSGIEDVPGHINEIDIIETFGKSQARKCPEGKFVEADKASTVWRGVQHVFYSSYGKAEVKGDEVGFKHCVTEKQLQKVNPFDGQYHVYSAEWAPGRHVIFKIDDVVTAKFGPKYASDQRVYMSLTNYFGKASEVHGHGSDNLVVDWVKVWEKQ